MQLLSMDQSVATQAASAGIDAAKELLSKKVRRVKVKLKNGFPILLRNNQGKP
jgi:Conjugative transposon, TraM